MPYFSVRFSRHPWNASIFDGIQVDLAVHSVCLEILPFGEGLVALAQEPNRECF